MTTIPFANLPIHVIARHYPDAARLRAPYFALLVQVICKACFTGREVDAGRLHPRCHEHKCLHRRRDDRHGPCAFMDAFDPTRIFPRSIRMAATLRQSATHRALESDTAGGMPAALVGRTMRARPRACEGALGTVLLRVRFRAFTTGMLAKLGLSDAVDDDTLVAEFLHLLAEKPGRLYRGFRRLATPPTATRVSLAMFPEPPASTRGSPKWRQRSPGQLRNAQGNPALSRAITVSRP